MKHTRHTQPFTRVAATTAVAALATMGLAMPAANAEGGGAKDLLTDNAQNMAGGGVNIHADNTCVEKIGDTAHVKFEVQHQPLMRSSDHHWTAADGYIALPKSLKNVKIGIKAVADKVDIRKAEEDYEYDREQRSVIYDTPVDMPIVDYKDNPNPPAMLGGSPEKMKDDGEIEDERVIGYVDRGFSKKTDPNPKKPGTVVDHYLPTEQELRDHIKKFDVHMRKLSPTPYTGEYGVHEYGGPFSKDMGFGMWYGNNITDYNIYEFGSVFFPTSFEIEADVVVEHDDTFVTGAVSNLGKRHSDEVAAGDDVMGFDLEGGVNGYDGWSRPGYLPPAIPSDPKMIEIYKDKLSDAGLDISPRIAPTSEMIGDTKYLRIGTDIRPSARGDAGFSLYKQFSLAENRAVAYEGQVPRSGEDGADISAAHVTLCKSNGTPGLPGDEETPETETPDTETPDTETPETETPETETPETETPETETPETETPETETPETETPETETPETETPETETPETDVPETETPETETPETETPETETPETDTPGTDTPETETPETDVAESETSETPAPSHNDNHSTGSRSLASTGASVIGISIGALVLIGAGIFLARRKKV